MPDPNRKTTPVSARTLSPAKPAAKRSPNRQRAIARIWVWTLGLGGAAFVVPHFLFQ
jgi:hypothetical protein